MYQTDFVQAGYWQSPRVTPLLSAPFFDDVHAERAGIGAEFYNTYEFSMPADHQDSQYVVEKAEVFIRDASGVTRAFIIKDVDIDTAIEGTTKRVMCEDSAQDELLCCIIEPVTNTDDTASEILTSILAGTRWQAGVVESPTTEYRTKEWTDYESVWEGVIWIAEEFNLEIRTRADVAGGQVSARYIDLVQQRGTYSGRMLSYARDTASMRRSGQGGEVYTAAYGLGATVGGALTTFSATEWTIAGGDPADKPVGETWVEDPTAVQTYGIRGSGGTLYHRYGVYRDSEETVGGRLLTKTWNWLQERTTPQYTYDVELIALELYPEQKQGDGVPSHQPIGVGDTVVVRDSRCYPPYQAEARVVEIRRSYSDPSRDSLTLGVPKKRLSDFMRDITVIKRSLNQ